MDPIKTLIIPCIVTISSSKHIFIIFIIFLLVPFLFNTTMEVPKNHQLCMMYAENAAAANEFFEERGLTRCDVWTKEHPTPLKAHLMSKDGKTVKRGFNPGKDLRLRPPAKSEGAKTLVAGRMMK